MERKTDALLGWGLWRAFAETVPSSSQRVRSAFSKAALLLPFFGSQPSIVPSLVVTLLFLRFLFLAHRGREVGQPHTKVVFHLHQFSSVLLKLV
jgi:hypothetical protein